MKRMLISSHWLPFNSVKIISLMNFVFKHQIHLENGTFSNKNNLD